MVITPNNIAKPKILKVIEGNTRYYYTLQFTDDNLPYYICKEHDLLVEAKSGFPISDALFLPIQATQFKKGFTKHYGYRFIFGMLQNMVMSLTPDIDMSSVGFVEFKHEICQIKYQIKGEDIIEIKDISDNILCDTSLPIYHSPIVMPLAILDLKEHLLKRFCKNYLNKNINI